MICNLTSYIKLAGGQFCKLGGSLELLNPTQVESFLTDCTRKCKEVSAGLYKFNEEYALKKFNDI